MSRPRWLTHFGFDAPPFHKDIADEQLWVPSSRQRVLDRLVEACTERGHVLLTGEPGVGKTCVLRALRQRLPRARFRLTYCHNATLGRRDFYRHICLALGLSPKATAPSSTKTVMIPSENMTDARNARRRTPGGKAPSPLISCIDAPAM